MELAYIIQLLQRALPAARAASDRDVNGRPAAVGVLLRQSPDDASRAEVLLIRRARREGDIWSGHIALPGGRHDPGDSSMRATASREIAEEVGVDVTRDTATFIGELPVLQVRVARAGVHAFVWRVRGDEELTLDPAEVDEARWVLLRDIRAADNAIEHEHVDIAGVARRFPAVALDDDVLWGITHRILESMFEIVDADMASWDLARFIVAQNTRDTYETALGELRAGRKRTHWMWFVFPQLVGLGRSDMSQTFGISGVDEARAYLLHPVLGERYLECCRALQAIAGTRRAIDVFGPVDAQKLCSSLTLYERAFPDPVFAVLLARWFNGRRDEQTLERAIEARTDV